MFPLKRVPAGKLIKEQGSQYVWIPRYSYRITTQNGYNQDVDSWNAVEGTSKSGKVEIIFSKNTDDTVTSTTGLSKDGYIAHPAFNFGTDKLTGIWVAKYEASRNDAKIDSVGVGTTVSSKPGVKSWVSMTLSDMFNYAYNLDRELESHMMKNTEWGAVAYLTNAIGKIPYINNYYASSSPYAVTGYAGKTQDESYVSGNANSYLWNSANGVKASTTHNVYGIYDMSGGAYEYVAAYLSGASGSYVTNLVNAAAKYKDVYTSEYSNEIKGDAVLETSSSSSGSTSWDGDCSYAPASSFPVFGRGGSYNSGSIAGVFCFSSLGLGGSGTGFRVVLAIP